MRLKRTAMEKALLLVEQGVIEQAEVEAYYEGLLETELGAWRN